MTDRREFLKHACVAAVGAATGFPLRANSEQSSWPKYRDTLSIDGESGLDLLRPEKIDRKAVAKEIAAVRASGLGATLLQVVNVNTGFEEAKRMIAQCKAKIAAHKDAYLLVGNASDLTRAHRERRLGVILRFQGAEPIGDDLDHITQFRQMGIRVIELTHNRRNLVGDGSTEPGNAGLSVYGHQVVERLNTEKIVVDVAHGSQRTMKEGIEASKAPAIISHTGCRALSDLPRLVGDAELRLLGERGGVAGIMFWPYLRTDTQPMAIDVIRHIEHAIDVCGEDHVGIGTDGGIAPIERTAEFEKQNSEMMKETVEEGYFGKGRNPEGLYFFIPDLNVANRFEVLAAKLSARGHSDARIEKILGGNFARVFAEVWG
jgi:membrane dipeptidase